MRIQFHSEVEPGPGTSLLRSQNCTELRRDTFWFARLNIYSKTQDHTVYLADGACCCKPQYNSINDCNYTCPKKKSCNCHLHSPHLCTTVTLTKLTHDSHFGISDCAESSCADFTPYCFCVWESVCVWVHMHLKPTKKSSGWLSEEWHPLCEGSTHLPGFLTHHSYVMVAVSPTANPEREEMKNKNPQLNCCVLWNTHWLEMAPQRIMGNGENKSEWYRWG